VSAEQANGVADPPSSSNGAGPHDPSAPASLQDAGAMRPEVAVGAAFLGGFLLAVLLRRVRS
jgi:hypothetical protein